MNSNMKKYGKMVLAIIVLVAVFLLGRGNTAKQVEEAVTNAQGKDIEQVQEHVADKGSIEKNGSYTSKEEVALYLHTYHTLPENYITKKEAEAQGWDNKAGNLQEIAPGKSIGGSHYGNYEKLLPAKSGRTWKECDIDYKGGHRGENRIIYSNDGLIYYTDDHYQTFEKLY